MELFPKTCGQNLLEKRGRLRLKTEMRTSSSQKPSELTVYIYEAKNLVPMDPNGLSDPYVKVKLVPDPKVSLVDSKNLN